MTAPFVKTVTKPAADTPVSRRLRQLLLLLVGLLILLLICTIVTWLVVPKAGQAAPSWLNRLLHRNFIDVCTLPKEVGPCRSAKHRFYFDSSIGSCMPFLYGGCEGNANRFQTIEQCMDRCGGKTEEGDTKQDHSITEVHYQGSTICSLPAATGDCRAAIPRFSYDSETSQCKEFLYGGCGGNANNFETMESCQQACEIDKSDANFAEGDVCTSVPEAGLCMAYMERFAFHPSTGTCEMFVYGGCGGNGNRYQTKDECEKRCKPTQEESRDSGSDGDHDTRVCGETECPSDCGLVRKDGDCLLCQCAHQPFLASGEIAVSGEEGCPGGYTEVRHDFTAVICTRDLPVPAPSP